MKIKNIRQYRTFYKENVRDLQNRNEHYIGTVRNNDKGEKEFGWFDIYHGDKEGYGRAEQGIGNFLESFLDMAKDGQAVYEFLQNAVDAGASHFTMAWGEDPIDGNNYLLIANNGEMFNFDSVRSILNVGSSTKTSDSQNIGKFGIGFKLAHRLVGKENGLVELLSSQPSGPILFSWENREIMKLAQEVVVPEPTDINFIANENNFKIADSNPWLFKILITCFPALPDNDIVDEQVFLSDGSLAATPVFPKEEIEVLQRWVASYSNYLNADTYQEGALFFIKLGAGKENDLADKNLREGVRFSLAILQEIAKSKKKTSQTLSTVQLNRDEPIYKPDLEYHLFKITKENHLEDYLYVKFGVRDISELSSDQKNKLDKEDDIEVLFGFRKYDEIGDYFRGAPNFYLYFPLSEEVHNFNFVLHSNAFYKASSRTFLHKGTKNEDGINERLLRTIAQRLEYELKLLYEQGEKRKFLDFYAALLTSSESQINERQWVKEPFIDEITKVLRKITPAKDRIFDTDFKLTNREVKIKETKVEVSPEIFNVKSFNWFYWGPNDPDIIRAKAKEKLETLVFDIFILFRNKEIFNHVNRWIEKDTTRIGLIFEELDSFDKNKVQSEHFKNNLKALKLFEFTDGKLLSDNDIIDIQDQGYLILHNNLSAINVHLRIMGIKTSIIDLDDFEFVRNYGPYLNTDGQLRSWAKVIEVISNGKVELLTSIEKKEVFITIRDMIEEGRRRERLSEFRLFKNSKGNCVKLKHLLKSAEKNWLEPYVIDTAERFKEIEFYLESDDDKIYTTVIKPFWVEIGSSIFDLDVEQRATILKDVESYYDKADEHESENLSTVTETLFFKGSLQKVNNPFYENGLSTLDEVVYKSVQNLLNDDFDVQIPDYDWLFAYKLKSLRILHNANILEDESYTFTESKIRSFLQFVGAVGIKLFDSYSIYLEDDLYVLSKDDKQNYFSRSERYLDEYIQRHHSDEFMKLPKSLSAFGGLLNYKDETLFSKLIDLSDSDNREELFDVISAASLNTKVEFFDKLDSITLQYTEGDVYANKTKLTFIRELIENDKVRLGDLQDKIIIATENDNINLSAIDVANDEIIIEDRDNRIKLSRSRLLNLENEKAIPTILSFAKTVIEKSLLTEQIAKKIFKISSEDITDDLIKRVIKTINDQENRLQNSDQLILLINSAPDIGVSINDFHVETRSKEWNTLKSNYVLLCDDTTSEYYSDFYVLSERYNDLFDKIGLRKGEVYFYKESEGGINKDIIYPEFTFQKGVVAEVLNPFNDDVKALNYLFKLWQQTPTNKRTYLDRLNWEKVLSFVPSSKVFSRYAIEAEKLDDSVINWVKENRNDRESFLRYIGVYTSNSDIAKLRSWFLNAPDNEPAPIAIETIPLELISNTLVGLADGEFDNDFKFKFSIDSKKHQVIESQIQRLMDNDGSMEIRLPIWADKSNQQLSLGSEVEGILYYLDNDVYDLLKEDENSDVFNKLITKLDIIYSSKVYKDFISVYPKLDTNISFYTAVGEIEHDEPFYTRWSEDSSIKLYRCERLIFNFSFVQDDSVVDVGNIEAHDVEVQYDTNSDTTIVYYQRKMSLEELMDNLSESGYTDVSSLVEELIEKRDEMLRAFYHTLTASGRDNFGSDDSKHLHDIFKKKELEDKRTELVENIKGSERYSYDWFSIYLDYLLTFEEKADAITQKSISFQKIERFYIDGIPTEKYFTLKGANNLIPLNIEVFEDFSITIVFVNRKKENITVEGVSKKGQDLLIYIPQGIDDSLVSKFESVVNVSINFTPVLDLLQRLSDAFSNEDIITPWNDIEESLPPLHFIYGPPGTGKTTKLVNIILEEFEKSYNFKALILVPTNKAGDVLAKRLVEKNSIINVLRIGNATDPDLEQLDENIYQSSIDEYMLDRSNVVISTIHRLPYYQIAKEHGASFKLFDSDQIKWDLVIFDESSMISLPYFAFALHAIKTNEKIIISGDPKQLPPVVDVSDQKLEELDLGDDSIYKMMEIATFDKDEQDNLREIDSIDYLDIQYRSVEHIGNLFSTISYSSQLDHGRNFDDKPIKKLPEKFYNPLKSHLSFIDLPIDLDNSILKPMKLLYSSYHVYAGIAVTELILNLDRCNDENIKYSIGVISPYKAQAMLMNKLLTTAGISDNITVFCDTVHGFQGDECDIIIFVVNPNNYHYTGHPKSLLSKEYIYNVAISRAKDYLWVMCPYNYINNNTHVNKLLNVAKGNKTMIESDNLEKYLFNDPDFIVQNTYLTGHDNINVFGQVEMSYFIKAGSNAIDIQLRR